MHDLTLAAQYADRLILLDLGAVVAAGSPEEVLQPRLLAAHYGANVTVLHEDGYAYVVPRRTDGASHQVQTLERAQEGTIATARPGPPEAPSTFTGMKRK